MILTRLTRPLGLSLMLTIPNVALACLGGEAARVGATLYSDVQSALDAAMAGETVLVCPGEHQGEHTWSGPGAITLASWSGSASDTILSGGGAVRILDAEGGDLTLRDLTLRDGLAPLEEGGGALRLREMGTVRLERVVVEDNASTGRSDYSESGGGAVTASFVDTLEVVSSRFLRNHVLENGSGGAIFFDDGQDLIITDSVFRENTAVSELGIGGAIVANAGSSVELRGSRFIRNRADVFAGAIRVHGRGPADVVTIVDDCDFVENEVFYPSQGDMDTYGGAILWQSGNVGSPGQPGHLLQVDGSRFLRNRVGDDGAGGAIRASGYGTDVRIRNSWFEGNRSDDDGGAIYLELGGHSLGLLEGNMILANEAFTGSALYVAHELGDEETLIVVRGGWILENASMGGGAVHLAAGATGLSAALVFEDVNMGEGRRDNTAPWDREVTNCPWITSFGKHTSFQIDYKRDIFCE